MNALPPNQLRHTVDPTQFQFETTAELEADSRIIGQPRGTRAIEFGVGIENEGYNIFVLGEMGTGRATSIERFLQTHAAKRETPSDWVYVNNFATPHKPHAIPLPAGEAAKFQAQMEKLVKDIQQDLPAAFATDAYKEAITAVQRELETAQNQQLSAVDATAREVGFALIQTAKGYVTTPLVNGQPITPEQIAQIAPDERKKLEATQKQLNEKLQEALERLYDIEQETREKLREIDRDVAETAVAHHFELLTKKYQKDDELHAYINAVHEDVLKQIDTFAPASNDTPPVDLRRYQVNVLVDNSEASGAPVILETNPTFHQLFGRIEYELISGALTTHFTLIREGSLHRANGGYLIVMANDLMQDGLAWDALKRALQHGELRVPISTQEGRGPVLAKTISPEPLPLNVKIILMGTSGLFHYLHDYDLGFEELFKVRADFDTEMDRTAANENAYAQFIAARCAEEGLRDFDKTAVSRVIEHGIRLTSHQQKLSTRFGAIADLVREASYWAGTFERDIVTAADVQQALHERIFRANRSEEHIQESILEESVFVETDGAVVGQVNGLSVLDTGEYAFGTPGRITVTTYAGSGNINHIERETNMSGPIHHKGFLTLTSYMKATYGQEQSPSFEATITFEQNYGGIDGDSASSTELYGLLSSLSGVPIKQGIAVTGSVNQKGEVQPIGGVNEKIEGFFRICQARGLTGEQGVMIPHTNVVNLMLHEDVITAVSNKNFHIWPIKTIDEGIERLTGLLAGQPDADGNYPEDTIHGKVQARLHHLDKKSDGDEEE